MSTLLLVSGLISGGMMFLILLVYSVQQLVQAWRGDDNDLMLLTVIYLVLTICLLTAYSYASTTTPAAALQYRNDVIRNARVQWGMNAPVADFAAQIHQESGWNPAARSPAGAQGMAQFMPATAQWIGDLLPALADKAPYNPGWAIRALVSYDRWLWARIRVADSCQRMAMTLSAYNGGLGWVNRDRRLAAKNGLDDQTWFASVETVNAGRHPAAWRENRGYPQRILYQLAPRYLTWGGSACVD